MRASLLRNLLTRRTPAQRGFVQRHQMLLSSSFAIIFIAMCGAAAVVNTITQATADTLSIAFDIQGQYSTTDSKVTMWAMFSQDNKRVYLSGKLSLTCNGFLIPEGGKAFLPRQPAGSTYTCVYTDDKGKVTTYVIPIPSGVVAITSPAPNSTIQLLGSPYGTPGYPPTPTPSGSPMPTPTYFVPPTVPPATVTPTPTPTSYIALVTTVTIRYTLPALPSGADARVSATAICGGGSSLPDCAEMVGPQIKATGAYLLTDVGKPAGSGFDTFPDNADGEIELLSHFSWSPPAGGFHGVTIAYDDTVRIPVTWNRQEPSVTNQP